MRIPLHIKLMVSYLLVVGLVFVPTFVYLRTIQQRDLRESLERDLRADLAILAERLAATPPDDIDEVAARWVIRTRVTIVDPNGNVLVDSQARGRKLENHADRTEVRQALERPEGFGTATRVSATLGDELVYAAMRFPPAGPPRGVVRLAVPTTSLLSTQARASQFLSQAGAVALSAAVLLSLVAALVVSRPLRRITAGARAFAAGDFGHPIDVASRDELGEVAQALMDLASQLRNRLLAAGADRATLQGLLDELPVGVILYDEGGSVTLVSGRVREICGLHPKHEIDRARAIFRQPEQASLVAEVLAGGLPREAPLWLPWLEEARLTARWICVFGPDGSRQPALVVLDAGASARKEEALEALAAAARALRVVASRAGAPFAAELTKAAVLAERALPEPPPGPADVRAVPIGELCRRAFEALADGEDAPAPRLELMVPDQEVRVVEAGGRSARAVRMWLAAARGPSDGPDVVKLRGEVADRTVRLSLRHSAPPAAIDDVARIVRSLGGDAGCHADGESWDAWLLLPRA